MTQASPEQMRQYAFQFERTYIREARALFNHDERKKLRILKFIRECSVHGFVSTTYGAGITIDEKGPDWFGTSASPVYDLFCVTDPDFPTTVAVTLTGGPNLFEHCEFGGQFQIDSAPVFICGSKFVGPGRPIMMKGQSARVSIADCQFGMGRAHKFIHYAYLAGDRSAAAWSLEAAQSHAETLILRARVEMLLDERRYAPLNQLTENSVIVLGDYTPDGSSRIDAIAQTLRAMGYDPRLVSEFADIPRQSLRAKVVTLLSVCRFAVMDDSGPGGHLTEYPYLEDSKTPGIVLRLDGTYSSSMTRGGVPDSTLHELDYSPSNLTDVLEAGVQWAEGKISQMESFNNEAYRSWRDNPQPLMDRLHIPYGFSPFVGHSGY